MLPGSSWRRAAGHQVLETPSVADFAPGRSVEPERRRCDSPFESETAVSSVAVWQQNDASVVDYFRFGVNQFRVRWSRRLCLARSTKTHTDRRRRREEDLLGRPVGRFPSNQLSAPTSAQAGFLGAVFTEVGNRVRSHRARVRACKGISIARKTGHLARYTERVPSAVCDGSARHRHWGPNGLPYCFLLHALIVSQKQGADAPVLCTKMPQCRKDASSDHSGDPGEPGQPRWIFASTIGLSRNLTPDRRWCEAQRYLQHHPVAEEAGRQAMPAPCRPSCSTKLRATGKTAASGLFGSASRPPWS